MALQKVMDQVAKEVASAESELAAAQPPAMKAAWLFDAGQPCGAEANAAKFVAAEAGYQACDTTLQTPVGRGYRKDRHVERL